jgi:hypothetical protein
MPADDGHDRGKRRQAAEAAALALAAGKTYAAAAEKAGIGERTLYRWAKRPAFKRQVAELRGRLISTAVGKLSKSMTAAAKVMTGLLKSDDENVRHKAARSVLELTTKLRDSEELDQRISELERHAAEQQGKNR